MARLIFRSIMGKLVLYFLAAALLSIALLGNLSYFSVKSAFERTELQQLKNLNDIMAERIRDYIGDVASNLTFMSKSARVTNFFQAVSAFQENKLNLSEFLDTDSLKDYLAPLDRTLYSGLEINGAGKGYEDYLAIDNSEGLVMYTCKKLSDSRSNIKTGPLKDSGLARVWAHVVKTRKPAMVDFSMYQPSNSPAAFLGMPVFSTDSKGFVGVLVLRINADHINALMKSVRSAGRTVESYIVGEDMLMRTDSRFQTASAILKTSVDADLIKLDRQSTRGEALTRDYKGDPVFIARGSVGLQEIKDLNPDFKWFIFTSAYVDEAISAAVDLGYRILFIALAVIVLVAVIAYFSAKTISRPIKLLSDQVLEASAGDLTVNLMGRDRKDEVGVLAQSVWKLIVAAREQGQRILEVVKVLSSAAAEISTTVAQLATSTAKTSTAVTETTATAEQVKQAARVSSDKAKKVSASAQQAVQVSEAGKKATEENVRRMNLIKEQMESIGETVVRLSEHSQAIENIIDAVQDIADQSNLLAVNASIEAARAGDQGKGFAVVAQEIKALADQSKNATEQVKSILEDTRNWVNAVVMATEQGGKAVDAGVAQSMVAGESIQSLANSVNVSSQAASVIDTTSEQQFAGVDQVARAMANIEEAMRQNLDGTSQLETAAKELEELGEFLKSVVRRFKI